MANLSQNYNSKSPLLNNNANSPQFMNNSQNNNNLNNNFKAYTKSYDSESRGESPNPNFSIVNNNSHNNNTSQAPYQMNAPQLAPLSPSITNYNPNSPIVVGNQYPNIIDSYQNTNALNSQYPVIEYKEKLFLKQVLVVATFTSWKFRVKENIDSFAGTILVSVRGEFEPFHQPNSVSIPICYCQSIDDYHFHSKSRRLVSDIPTWKAYRLPPEINHEGRYQLSRYIVVLSKPQKWGSQMLPVTFFFKGIYDNRFFWEKHSTQGIILTNSANKWYEKAFITLCFVNFGYNPKSISKLVDSYVKWEHFIAMVDYHVHGTTGCKRFLSHHTSVFSPLHLNSLMKMVKCNEKNLVSIKNIRHFCTESQDGGAQSPLKQIEDTLNRYRESWESGKIVGIIESNVVEKFLLNQNLPTGSFILRIQYNNPSEICASSLQILPQSGGSQFVDHLTISRHVAPNDEKLMEYLYTSSIHQLLLPFGMNCNIPMNSQSSFGPTKSYRTTDQELQRTNQLLQKALQSGFNPLEFPLPDPNINGNINSPSPVHNINNGNNNNNNNNNNNINANLPSMKMGNDSAMDIKPDFRLDGKVASWLTSILHDESILNEVLEKFSSARVSLESLLLLDKDDLKEMGIPIAPRKLIIKSLENLRTQNNGK